MNYKRLALCVLLLTVFQLASAELNCLSNSGQPISWWSALKMPITVGTHRHLYYDHADEQANATAFKVVNSHVDDSTTALYKTIDQLNSLSRETTHIMAISDQHPNGWVQFDGAHSKGVVAWDTISKTGFYLMHSAPKFPVINETYIRPTLQPNAWKYGQNFFCVGIDSEGLQAIQNNLAVTFPSVYYDNGKLGPQQYNAINFSNATFKARMSGQHFAMISKSPNDTSRYLYEDILSPYFQERFMVESWCHPGQEPLCDRQYPNVNIKRITHKAGNITFPEDDDHAKWAISFGGKRNISCSSDINKAFSQRKRGGCALCFESNENYYQALRDLVSEHDDCNSNSDDFLAIIEDLYNNLVA